MAFKSSADVSHQKVKPLLLRADQLRTSATEEDAAEIEQLVRRLQDAVERHDDELVAAVSTELENLLFYIGA